MIGGNTSMTVGDKDVEGGWGSDNAVFPVVLRSKGVMMALGSRWETRALIIGELSGY